jgi:transcriptional regulator with XRE-family HTH domain
MTDKYEVPASETHGYRYPPISNAIRLSRQDALMDRGEMALRCGVSERTIERWETGKSVPTRRKLMLIASVTGRDLDWFPLDNIPLHGQGRPGPTVKEDPPPRKEPMRGTRDENAGGRPYADEYD